jgi:5-methylcytosine-specific restriction endonuclease McrA
VKTWGGRPSQRLRAAVLERDGRVCYWCGGFATSADHYPIARADGGPDTLDNLVAACLPCNQRRGGELIAARRIPPPPARTG